MLGLGTTITSIDSGQIYKELSELDNYTDLDVHFDFSTLAGTHGDEVDTVTNLGAADGVDIDSNEGTPTLDRTTMSRASVAFTGSDTILDMEANYTTTNKASTIFMVFQKGDLTNDYILASSDDSNTASIKTAGGGGSILCKYGNTSHFSIACNNTDDSSINYTFAANTPTVLVVSRNTAGEVVIYADNNLKIAEKANTTSKAGATFTLGAIGGTTSGSLADWIGNVCEVGIYDVELSVANITILLESLCTKWGVDRRE